MTTETLTLTDFLLARIAEDEADAQRFIECEFSGVDAWGDGVEVFFRSDGTAPADPARVLAECEAKRRIVEEAALWGCQKTMCKILALPYADHPDYREEWRP